MTGGKWQSQSLLVDTALAAASQAVRNACGWHVSPSMKCKAKVTATGKLAKLPTCYVSAVDHVKELQEDGTWASLTSGEYEWRDDGLLRRTCFKQFPTWWDAVKAEYDAGYDAAAVPDLAFAVVGIAEGVLSLPTGVASESADGVSISYSAQAQSVANAMTSQFAASLAPYRLVSSHAA